MSTTGERVEKGRDHPNWWEGQAPINSHAKARKLSRQGADDGDDGFQYYLLSG